MVASDFELSTSAFEEGFNKKQYLRAWEKVGAAPVTQNCLESVKACRKFGNEVDKMNEVMKWIQEQNNQCTFFLTGRGYDGPALSSQLNKKEVTA